MLLTASTSLTKNRHEPYTINMIKQNLKSQMTTLRLLRTQIYTVFLLIFLNPQGIAPNYTVIQCRKQIDNQVQSAL